MRRRRCLAASDDVMRFSKGLPDQTRNEDDRPRGKPNIVQVEQPSAGRRRPTMCQAGVSRFIDGSGLEIRWEEIGRRSCTPRDS